MKIYDNAFQTYKHLESKNSESCTWEDINSTALAEIMELAEKNGYKYNLECFDYPTSFGAVIHRRTMVFIKER